MNSFKVHHFFHELTQVVVMCCDIGIGPHPPFHSLFFIFSPTRKHIILTFQFFLN